MQIGWIGTGVMGASMAGHLMQAGHALTLHSRTRSKAESLLARGARWAETPRQAASEADALCVMVGFPQDVEQVILGANGALAGLQTGALLIDFTTSRPSLAIRIAENAAARGVLALDAPVSGGDKGAHAATLSIMVGGEEQAFVQALPILQCLGKTIVHHGPAGYGQQAKMVNQILIASNMMGVCEGLLYARQAGLDPQKTLASVENGAAASWSLSNLYPRILKGDMAPGFYIEHFVKDLQIALEEAERMKLTLPGLELAQQLYATFKDTGGARMGTQALIRMLERINAIPERT